MSGLLFVELSIDFSKFSLTSLPHTGTRWWPH